MMPLSKRCKICIGGYIVGGPLGGLVWHHLQYVLGLHLMGHEVLFVEDSDDYPSCYNPVTHQFSTDPAYGLAFLQEVFAQFGLADKWAYFHRHSHQWFGRSGTAVAAFAARADIFLNLSGVHPLPQEFAAIPTRVFVDTDPAFTQVRHLTEQPSMERAARHTHFFTYGENAGSFASKIPNDGFDWKPTRQPVVAKVWKSSMGQKQNAWTTVMQWDSYQVRQFEGISFGMKSASFQPYFRLPMQTRERFELAIGSATAPRILLESLGWHLQDPIAITKTPESFQQYLTHSKGEWSVAKQGYVSSNSGWFSERSAGYLASGRPVVVQDTGFSRVLPCGEGLLCFSSPEEALAALSEVDDRYHFHCRKSREIAETFFRSDLVLEQMLGSL